MSQFTKGKSGNPKGRPKGSTNKSIGVRKIMSTLLEKEGPSLMRVATKQAKAGDSTLLKALMDRLLPTLKSVQAVTGAPLNAKLTDQENRGQIMQAMAEGRLSIDDGSQLLNALKLGVASGSALNITLNLGAYPRPAALPSVVLENGEGG